MRRVLALIIFACTAGRAAAESATPPPSPPPARALVMGLDPASLRAAQTAASLPALTPFVGIGAHTVIEPEIFIGHTGRGALRLDWSLIHTSTGVPSAEDDDASALSDVVRAVYRFGS